MNDFKHTASSSGEYRHGEMIRLCRGRQSSALGGEFEAVVVRFKYRTIQSRPMGRAQAGIHGTG